jgi:hypothetical protein
MLEDVIRSLCALKYVLPPQLIEKYCMHFDLIRTMSSFLDPAGLPSASADPVPTEAKSNTNDAVAHTPTYASIDDESELTGPVRQWIH